MKLHEFKNLLKTTDKKIDVFIDSSIIENINFSITELIELIKSNLTSKEILDLFNYKYYQQLPDTLKNDLISCIEFPMNSAVWVILDLNDDVKRIFLYNKAFILKNFSKNMIAFLCKGMDEKTKEEIMQLYAEEGNVKIDFYMNYTDEKKFDVLVKEHDLTLEEKLNIIFSLKDENIGIFLLQNPYFCDENAITKADFMNKLLNCKRRYISNCWELDRSIDITDFPMEYKECINSDSQSNKDFIAIDLNSNLEKYRGLDRFIRINPQEFNEDKIKKLMELCDICPNLQVCNRLGNNPGNVNWISSGQEYKEAEEWISSVIEKIKPEYTKAQKIAIIDNEIGKKISYCANFGTKNFNENDARCLWKIISSGYGVCNGIANIEQYIFNRIGIESEFIEGCEHAFLKVKNVDILLSNGQSTIINGILDPTWNLAAHKFGGKPKDFLISYEEARKHDINKEGEDLACHSNDEKLQELNYTLPDSELQNLFCSVGITNRDGVFPLKIFMNELKYIDEHYLRKTNRNSF